MSGKIKARTESQIDEFIEDLENEDDEIKSTTEETKEFYIKTLVYLKEIGMSLNIFEICSISKRNEFIPQKGFSQSSHWVFKIMINENIEQSIRYPVVDIKIDYLNEEMRDKRYEEILNSLKEVGVRIIEV